MCVQGQRHGWSLLDDPNPGMFMAVDPSLMPLGDAKPALQIEIVPNLIHFIPAHEEAGLEAAHHLGHVFVERITGADKASDQFLKVGLTLGAIALFRVQGVRHLLDLLDLFAENILLGLDRAQTFVDTVGQAAELLFCAPPFFASKFRWIDRRTSVSAWAIRKPGG
jgi:hypothetical protein